MSAKVFISYSHKDEATAQRLIKSLSQQHIEIGNLDTLLVSEPEPITQDIRKQIKEAKAVIVLLSKNSQRSSWVAFELGVAMAFGVSIVPVLLSDSQGDIPSYLNHLPIRNEGPELYEELKQLLNIAQ